MGQPEIEVTEAMIEAGQRAYWDSDENASFERVTAIYRAMQKVRGDELKAALAEIFGDEQ